MFSGIIQHCGTVLLVETRQDALRILIRSPFHDLKQGESIAVDGICLTVQSLLAHEFYCDISLETMRVTTAHMFKAGSVVNLERSLRLADRIDGHLVSGHVDQYAFVESVQTVQGFVQLKISQVADEHRPFLIKKGSIAVNGVSLTLNEVFSDQFELMLIPHTLDVTNLKFLKPKDKVNLEFDTLIKAAVNAVHGFLREQGKSRPVSF